MTGSAGNQFDCDSLRTRVELGDTEPPDLAGAYFLGLRGLRRATAFPTCLQHRGQRGKVGLGRWILGRRLVVLIRNCKLASGLNAFAKFHLCGVAGDRDDAPTYHITRLMLGKIFIDAGWNQLLHSQLQTALVRVDLQHLSLDRLADAEHVLRMVDALLGAD